MAMHDPPHPGELVRHECLEPLGLSVARAADGLGVTRQALSDLARTPRLRCALGLGVTRQALSDLVNGEAGVSTEMAIRLSKAFGSTPETWLGMQMAYDLWQARDRADRIEVERFATA